MSEDCSACGLHWLKVQALRIGGNRCDNDGCPMFTAQQISEVDPATDPLKRLKSRIDMRLNDYLCQMKEGYDDSITGFNEAWSVIDDVFAGEIGTVAEGLCQCPKCGRTHRDLGFGKPPAAIAGPSLLRAAETLRAVPLTAPYTIPSADDVVAIKRATES